MIFPFLTIAPSGNKGKGVFTSENIPANTIIEISPVIVLSAKERKQLENTKLFHYIFEWGDSRKKAAVALGYVSMYNHSYDANCEYEMDFDEASITIKTVKAIKKGEELHINYNAVHNDATEVWFHHLIDQS
ncbi:MAG TPA: SET domain-containing protein [Arachidicoccus soli]|nr:SET domain-containing protein [Arachidicoccus soli]